MLCIFDLSDGSSCVINGFNLRSLSTLQAKYKYVKKHDSAIIHIFYVSLNVLRPTFFSIYNLPFLLSPNISKIRVKVGPKTNYFSYILSSCTNRVAVFNNFFSLICSQPRDKQNRARNFFLSKYFLNNLLLTLFI